MFRVGDKVSGTHSPYGITNQCMKEALVLEVFPLRESGDDWDSEDEDADEKFVNMLIKIVDHEDRSYNGSCYPVNSVFFNYFAKPKRRNNKKDLEI
jgi:hypothetical protein